MPFESRDADAMISSVRYGASPAPSVRPARDVNGAALWKVVSIFALSAVFATLGVAHLHAGAVPRRALGQEMPSHEGVRASLPVLVVGLPKTGTTSLANFFHCGGLTTSHYKCVNIDGENVSFTSDGSTMDQTCGRCIRDALATNQPPLKSCGNFEAWAQMDVAGKPDSGCAGLNGVANCSTTGGSLRSDESSDDTCFFPQVDALDALDAEFPEATLVLNTRASPESWISSVDDWNDLRERLRDCEIRGLPVGEGERGPEGDAQLIRFVEQHEANVRAFVSSHPSHRLVEVTIEDSDAGNALEAAFGIPASCWGRENAKEPLGGLGLRKGGAPGVGKVLVF
jgi:hypothetical protein